MKSKCQAKLIEVLNTGGAAVPDQLLLLPAGESQTLDGLTYLVDQAAATSILSVFEEHGVDLVIDYEHQSQGEGKAPAGGWIKRLWADANGIWAQVEWTEQGREYVAAKEYRYLSPVVWREKDTGRVRAIASVALTNTPRINNYQPITNKAGGMEMDKILNALREIFGLADSAGEEDCLGAVEKLANSYKAAMTTLRTLAGLDEKAEANSVLEAIQNKLANPPGGDGKVDVVPNSVSAALGLQAGAAENEVLGAIKGLQAGSEQSGDMAKELNALKEKWAKREAEEMVENAIKAGKLVPAQKDWGLEYAKGDPKGFEAYLNTAPKVVPTGGLPGAPDTAPGGGPDAVQQEFNSMMGLSEEDWKKFGPKGAEEAA